MTTPEARPAGQGPHLDYIDMYADLAGLDISESSLGESDIRYVDELGQVLLDIQLIQIEMRPCCYG